MNGFSLTQNKMTVGIFLVSESDEEEDTGDEGKSEEDAKVPEGKGIFESRHEKGYTSFQS